MPDPEIQQNSQVERTDFPKATQLSEEHELILVKPHALILHEIWRLKNGKYYLPNRPLIRGNMVSLIKVSIPEVLPRNGFWWIGFCFSNRGATVQNVPRIEIMHNALSQASAPFHTIIPALIIKIGKPISWALVWWEASVQLAGTCPR